MGSIVWQLNDCRPVVSWAAVDGHGRRKPPWYALRTVYADRLMTVRDGGLHLGSDSARPWEGTLRLSRHGLDGSLPAEEETVAGAGGARGEQGAAAAVRGAAGGRQPRGAGGAPRRAADVPLLRGGHPARTAPGTVRGDGHAR
ncbi:hypothetical protein [Streptomyces finlayi]|uniref:hypothetical protein n=1 Tax=Streptomyces finlayi TaxID=67296 RepID=UPI0021561AA9|nr:hypothetical protein [Streptomyces finlayi]